MSSSFDQLGDESPNASNHPYDDGFLSSQQFDSFSNFADSESAEFPAADDDSPAHHAPSPPPIYASGGGLGSDPDQLSTFKDEKLSDDAFAFSNGPILPPPTEMQEEGFALREWIRQNALQLEEKEKRERELLSQIIDEADGYKVEFYKKRQVAMEANKATCREKEKLFLASHEKFYAEADKNYWKAIAELVPNEVPKIEKKGKKNQEKKKPSIAVIQGPKPGKPTELSRMRQILLKLKHSTPPHLKPSSSPPPTTTTDANTAARPAAAVTVKPISVA